MIDAAGRKVCYYKLEVFGVRAVIRGPVFRVILLIGHVIKVFQVRGAIFIATARTQFNSQWLSYVSSHARFCIVKILL